MGAAVLRLSVAGAVGCIKGAVGERCSQEKDAGLSCSHHQAVETSVQCNYITDTHHQHSVQTINVGLDIQHSSLMTSYLSPNKFFSGI